MRTHRLITFVTALVAECFLVLVHEPTVPGWEDTTVVDLERLLNMNYNKVVEL
jgi:hypothetical protein